MKNRRPERWSADRNRTSGEVFVLRLPCIVLRTAALDAQDPRGSHGSTDAGSGGVAPVPGAGHRVTPRA